MRVPSSSWRASSRGTPALALVAALACADPAAPAADAPPAPRRSLAAQAAGGAFLETFDLYTPLTAPTDTAWRAGPVLWLTNDGRGPALPLPRVIDAAFRSPTYDRARLAGWTVVKHTRDPQFWRTLEGPFDAWHHGTTCDAPPLQHPVTSYEESVFLCRNHMMTAVNASGYGVTYLTPEWLADFSAGTATVRFDVATLRNTGNDWIDLWITPYDENLVTPLDKALHATDLQGAPRHAVHVRMSAEARTVSAFRATLVRDHVATALPAATSAGYESRLTQSATVREQFVLELSRTRVRFGMPARGLWWVDAAIPDLGWSRGVVQIGHHSLNPRADGGTPTTWHWDNVGVSPAVPFTVVNATARYADATSPELALRAPAPAGARLRFAAHGLGVQVSFDGGSTWVGAWRQQQELDATDRFRSYWMPIPAGAQRVRFRAAATPGFASWFVRDVAVWASDGADDGTGAGSTTCTGTLGGATVGGTLTVPAGATCVLGGTRVQGSIEVRARATLVANGVVVGGNVQADGARRVSLGGGSTVSGDVQVKLAPPPVAGPAASAAIDNALVLGNVQVEENAGAVSITATEVRGNLQAQKNAGGLTISGNRVAGDLQCQENRPAPTGGANVAKQKDGQCRGL